MNAKRLIAAVLWFNAGWFVASAAAFALGVSGVVAPFVALAVAWIILVDPRRMIWQPTSRQRLRTSVTP